MELIAGDALPLVGTKSPAVTAIAPEIEPQRVTLQVPVDVRSLSLAVLTVLACLVVTKWAAAVLVPLMLGLMTSYALTPIVDLFARWRIPRAIGAAVLLLGIVGSAATLAYSRSDDAAALIEALPASAAKLKSVIGANSAPAQALEKVQRVANELQQTAEEKAAAQAESIRGPVTRLQVERPRFDIKEYLWSGTLGLVGFIGQIAVVCFIAYFLLASGDSFRRNLVKMGDRTLSQKKVTVQALDEITQQIQLYLLVQLGTSALVGVATWLAFLWLGLEHSAVWGIAAAVLNLIPYLGSIAIAAASAMLGLLQFGTIQMALTIAGAAVAIHIVSGYLITPWLTGKVGRMNPVVIFVGVLVWGWLWGVWGLLLGIPILMAIKAVCDRIEDLKPIGDLLGQ